MKMVDSLKEKGFDFSYFKNSQGNKNISNDTTCVLATDFSQVDKEMEIWKEKRDAKSTIYIAFRDYIICLENSLEHETDSYKRYLIEKEIKKVKKEQKKYCVPSVLEIDSYDYINSGEKTVEKSSFSLIKKFKKN